MRQEGRTKVGCADNLKAIIRNTVGTLRTEPVGGNDNVD